MDVPSQDVISRDNVSVKINFRVVDPERAIIHVEDFLEATSKLAQTTLRSVPGKHERGESAGAVTAGNAIALPEDRDEYRQRQKLDDCFLDAGG